MSQFPHDRLNKNIFELCLENFGEIKIQRPIQSGQNIEPEEQALIMQLSPLLLERIAASEQRGEQRGELKGYQELVLRILKKKIGSLSVELEAQVKTLSLAQAENLGEMLLDFTEINDLLQWLEDND